MSSAIDTTFTWCRNPTAINGLQTTYCSKRGSDVSGDGTANNPYASIAKATAMATANTNIMLDDGEWDEARTANNRVFIWWGNGKTILKYWSIITAGEIFYHIVFYEIQTQTGTGGSARKITIYNCIIVTYYSNNANSNIQLFAYDSIVFNYPKSNYFPNNYLFERCILFNEIRGGTVKNSILFKAQTYGSYFNCNFITNNIPSSAISSINNMTTGQTIADYFNNVEEILNNGATTTNTSVDYRLLQCDFTAKAGSKNIGVGEKGTTIGLNEGFTMYADNSANDMFSPSNGATLKNIAWDSTLNGYVLVQKERVCQGATSTTITLDSSASAVDDYYNNLFVGIVAGDGYGELFLITDYDGTTKTATIDGTWTTTPNTNSIYTISGTILSAVKDLGKAIKVKRNWTFADNFTALQDGRWAEFLTHVETNGKQFPANCYSYEYSLDGVNFVQGQTADDLVSATNGENKVTDNIYGDCSPNYDESTAKNLIMRYIRVRVHIGFNI